MKRILVVALSMFALVVAVPVASWAFGVKDVVAMSQYGIPDSLIVEKIHHSGTQFDLEAKDLLVLKAAKVSDDVVVAMLRTEDRARTAIFYDGRYWPYDPQWYVGLNLGYYAPVYVGRAYGYRGYGRGRR